MGCEHDKVGKVKQINKDCFEEYKSTGRVVIAFTRDNCSWCDKLKPLFEKFAEDHKDIKFASFKLENPEMASQYGIATTPTLVYYEDGVKINLIKGYTNDISVIFTKFTEEKKDLRSFNIDELKIFIFDQIEIIEKATVRKDVAMQILNDKRNQK